MNKMFYFLTFIIIPSLYGMENFWLSSIEKQLVATDVKKRGKEPILAEIYTITEKNSPLMYDEESGLFHFTKLIAYKIDELFYKTAIDTDALTKTIFNKIEKIEKNDGYCPGKSYEDCTQHKNVLGLRTHYWWLKDEQDNYLPTVRVTSEFLCTIGDQIAIKYMIEEDLDKDLPAAFLTSIEKRLLFAEVEKVGKEYILAEINKDRNVPFVYDKERQIYSREIPYALVIDKIFKKKHKSTNALTKSIFSTIKEIEKEKGYDPDNFLNKLGAQTEYHWLVDENGKILPKVRVEAYFKSRRNQNKLLEILVDNYSPIEVKK